MPYVRTNKSSKINSTTGFHQRPTTNKSKSIAVAREIDKQTVKAQQVQACCDLYGDFVVDMIPRAIMITGSPGSGAHHQLIDKEGEEQAHFK